MAAVSTLYARCGSCGLTCAQTLEKDVALGPQARLPIVCTLCGAKRDYITKADPAEERRIQANARREASTQAPRHAEIVALKEAHDREQQEAWVLLGAEFRGLGPIDPGSPDA